MSQIWCVDLDGTITAFPDEMRSLMEGLQASGNEVHVLTGHQGDSATPDVVAEKQALLSKLGCGNCYDQIVVVANPKNDVADQKVSYMQHVKATALIDNNHKNVHKVRKAGFLVMRPGGKNAKAS